ncbi:MAG: TonB-dependent receptor family protein [Gemmatimonadota bacterium]
MMRGTTAIALCAAPLALSGQTPDTTKPYTLPPTTVSVTRAERPLTQIPNSIQTIDRQQISRARPTWGLDEALVSVPGVYVANRYNFSQDQRISIRGFGARSAFAVRGIKILVDGIPQTLPDGQGQLTNIELGEVDRIEVLRGSTSALYGNASGGVISVWTNPHDVVGVREDARFLAGRFAQNPDRTWSKWQSTTGLRVLGGSAQVTVSRLDYEGERDHSAADQRVLNARLNVPLATGWSLALLAAVGNNPQADNPGSLTFTELTTNRNTAPPLNRNRDAGKAVKQFQTGATVRRTMANGGEAAFTVYGLTRDLKNPITTTYIDLGRVDYGTRTSATYPLPIGARPHRLTFGFDFQRQQDDRKNFAYLNTPGDSAKPDTVTLDQLEHVTEFGPFVQSALDVSPTVTVTAGLRYDWVKFTVRDRFINDSNPDDSGERLMQALSGSLGVAVNPSRALTVYGNIASSFETPTTTELANSPSGVGGFNTGLDPQHAWNYEVGARGALGERFTYSGAVFQADVRDALIPYEIAAPRFFYRNAGSTRHRGVELSGNLAVFTGVSVNVIWTYSNYRFLEYSFTDTLGNLHVLDGRELSGIPKNWFHTVVRVEPVAFRGVWLEVQQSYSSGYFVNDTQPTRTAPWWATNVRLGWEGKAGQVRLGPFLGINNAFNHLYVSSVVINAARDRFYEPAPGRNAYLGLTVGAGR